MYAFCDRLSGRLLAALVFALATAPAVHAGADNNFTLDADAPGIDRMQVIVRAHDLEQPLRYEFVAEAGEIAGGFRIPPGESREIVLLGFDERGREPVFRGTTLLTVGEALNGPVTIPLTSIESDTSVVATIGTYRVWAIREPLGTDEGIRFRAGLIDGDGMPVDLPPKDLRWDVFDHPKNGVFPCSTQELSCVELRPPLRVNADVVACFKDVFCKASPSANDPYVQVAVGEFHTCARTQSGRVFCWRSNQRGQLGVVTPTNVTCAGMPQNCSPFPVEVLCAAGTTCRFISVAAGGTLTCAVDTNSRTWCWGWPATASSVHREIRAIDGNTGAQVPLVHVDVARTYGCGLSSSNDIWCFGADQFWQPQSGSLFNADAEMVPGGAKYRSVVVGESHGCGVQTGFTGVMDCWGYNYYSQISSNLSKVSPQFFLNVNAEHKALLGQTGISMGAAGFTNTCAQTTSGDTVCWGKPEPTYQYGTESVVLPGSYTATSIATSKSASCASSIGSYTCVRVCVASGPLHCGAWVPGTHLPLVPSQPQYKVFTQVDMEGNHQCALTTHGEIWCWGNNEFGQLGDGTASSTGSSKPVQVTPIRNPVTVKIASIVFP